jgi:hypothetical protein
MCSKFAPVRIIRKQRNCITVDARDELLRTSDRFYRRFIRVDAQYVYHECLLCVKSGCGGGYGQSVSTLDA